MPEITVVIPVYNRPHLVAEAVSSVLVQKDADFELILVDDGSDKETVSVLEKLTDAARQIRLLQLSHTGYPGLVRNRGAALADSRYLAFLDSDDLWKEDKLALQVAALKHSGLRISHTREVWLRRGREISQAGQKHIREGCVFLETLKKCMIGPSTVLMETELFHSHGGFSEDLEIAEDYDLWIRICARELVHYLDVPLTVKRAGHGDQLSEKYGQIEIFRLQVLERLLAREVWTPDERELLLKEFRHKASIYAQGCRKRGRNVEAQRYEKLAQSQ